MSRWSEEDVTKLKNAAEKLEEAVNNAVKEAHAYRDEVSVMGVQAITDGADAIVDLVENGLKVTLGSGAETIANVAKVELSVLAATGNR